MEAWQNWSPPAVACRPADRAALDGDTAQVGVPSDVPSSPNAEGRYYFCLATAATADTSSGFTASCTSDDMAVGFPPLRLPPA